MLKIGDAAPDFTTTTDANVVMNLSDLIGKYVVLYFYPRDDTPGCTIEANGFNKLKPEFDKLDSVILGISKDNLDSHGKFKEKYCLNFDLVSDCDSNICEQYGTWGEKSIFGKKYMGITRSTFLVDPEGKIAYIWPKVQVLTHAKNVLKYIEKLRALKDKNRL